MNQQTSGIYLITNLVNGKVYVGSSLNVARRMATHRRFLNNGRHSNQYLLASWVKYGSENFSFSLLEEVSIESLIVREAHFMEIYDSLNPSRGYNLESAPLNRTPESFNQERIKKSVSKKNRVVSEETRKKMSEWRKGKPLSEETKAKMREAAKSRLPFSEEHKSALRKAYQDNPELKLLCSERAKKMSQAKVGSKLTPQHRATLSESQKRAWQARKAKGDIIAPENEGV